MRNSRECGKSSPLQKITQLAKNNKQAGFGEGKTHTKSYALNNSTFLWLTTILHVSSIEPTLPPLTHRTMSTALAVHIVPRQQQQQAGETTNERRKTEVVFFPPTNRFFDLSLYNRIQVIQHCSVFPLSFFFPRIPIWQNLFLIHRHFPFRFGLFFLPFWVFFRQRHLLFCLSTSLYLFQIFLWKFCVWFNIEQR